MKNLGDRARRFLSQHIHEQQPEGSRQYTPPQPQYPGEEEDAPPQQFGAYAGQGQPHPSYPGEPPNLQPQNSQGSTATPPPTPGSGGRPIATRGVVPPNPYYTPPQGDRPQEGTTHAYPPGGSQTQEPYPPQGYLPQQQGGGGFLGGMGGGLLSGLAGGLAGSMIGNAIFGDHGQTEVAAPREEIINFSEEAPQGVQDPNAGFDPNTGGWDSAGGSWDNPSADWGDGGGGDTFGGDGGGWV
jgi:hypothetical protein